ncbi:hypothetical protein AVEN_245683-1 [Araneus ventricosus]|uniref:Integrase catalytic domain-containing protein n=1 Tax=Araneus ventricosus TaxID=182803 RepID=A0A4Y2NT32_ARAVE|nr:hypothetical protein AVEN_245683-1 [Araneus ventricosus]
MCPFPTSEGKTYCLTCIDRFTCWIEVIPFVNVTAEILAREFYDHWISRFGMPYRVITDQGISLDLSSLKTLVLYVYLKYEQPQHITHNVMGKLKGSIGP